MKLSKDAEQAIGVMIILVGFVVAYAMGNAAFVYAIYNIRDWYDDNAVLFYIEAIIFTFGVGPGLVGMGGYLLVPGVFLTRQWRKQRLQDTSLLYYICVCLASLLAALVISYLLALWFNCATSAKCP